jgi:hypothetical protein
MEKRAMLQVTRNFERFHRDDCARFAVFASFAIWVGGFPELAEAQHPGQKTFPLSDLAPGGIDDWTTRRIARGEV